MSARDLPCVEGRSWVAGRLHPCTDDLADRLEELVGRLVDMATEIELARAELVFWQPPLTDDELEAAA